MEEREDDGEVREGDGEERTGDGDSGGEANGEDDG